MIEVQIPNDEQKFLELSIIQRENEKPTHHALDLMTLLLLSFSVFAIFALTLMLVQFLWTENKTVSSMSEDGAIGSYDNPILLVEYFEASEAKQRELIEITGWYKTKRDKQKQSQIYMVATVVGEQITKVFDTKDVIHAYLEPSSVEILDLGAFLQRNARRISDTNQEFSIINFLAHSD